MYPNTVLYNGRITTDARPSFAQAVAITDGKVLATDDNDRILSQKGPSTNVIDLGGRTVIPSLNDSHTHLIRGGLNYNLELRWDGVPSLADGLRMLREQARTTPPGQWVRVVGDCSEFQFAERRMPTLEELNEAAPDMPVLVLHLYDRAFLNRAALRAVGYTSETRSLAGGEIERDNKGNPTGLLLAQSNAMLLHTTLSKGPKLTEEYQANSTRHFMGEMNRFGITSVVDAGVGFQSYPEDYQVIDQLHKNGEMTVRIAYDLFTQKPEGELDDFRHWATMGKPGQGDGYLRHNGAGEMLVFSAADAEDFVQPRPDLPGTMEDELRPVVELLARNRWHFRLHVTYDESITRALNLYEAVNRDVPLNGLHGFIDHAETISARNIDRIAALGGGIAVQNRMAFQGEHFRDRHGSQTLRRSPPVREMLRAGVPVGGGTDATRVASYNPFVSLYWLVTGKTVGGRSMYPDENCLDRAEALRLWTTGSSWFSTEDGTKGALAPGQLADLAVVSSNYFSVPEEEIKRLESVLTFVGGVPIYAVGEFRELAPPVPPVLPDWSPVKAFGGYSRQAASNTMAAPQHTQLHRCGSDHPTPGLGCFCWAF